MQLYLMQHGAALSKELDADQPLSPVGRDAVLTTASAMRRLGVDFPLILTSQKARAWQSAGLIAAAFGLPDASVVRTEQLSPTASLEAALAALAEGRDEEALLVVGHQPTLGMLVSHVIAAGHPVALLFEPAGLACLEVDGATWRSGLLRWRLSPAQLRLIARS